MILDTQMEDYYYRATVKIITNKIIKFDPDTISDISVFLVFRQTYRLSLINVDLSY